ncbi:sodium:solute symporter family protein [Lacicoccus alkaliphilus]|uniref:Solute:Na+ symporter, SSS family n=1 Tax=Lacicoccus alkaliphilus DSM 16010 TaxID=1123231 RepID=A0A1M7IRN1_9BACL|nr:sodium:solute symporter family protein [Salinicoccus alkaliphilus]SHM43349.1 solute:Na+ symporter, SSS family [Salinicoccus alkaliphilus DSM 16010]
MFSEDARILLSVIVFAYFIFLFVMALYMTRKNKTYEDYNVAGRSVSIFPIIMTFIGTGVGGSTLLGYMENGYRLGMGQQWIHISIFLCVIIFATFLIKRIGQLGEQHHMVTIGDYTTLRYSKRARVPTVFSILFSYCAMTGTNFIALATILNLTIGLDFMLGIFIGWFLLTSKTYFGGLKAIIWQDVIHGIILTVGIIILFITVVSASGGWGPTAEYAASVGEGNMLSVMNISTGEILIYLFTLGLFQLVRQDLWQRVWASKSVNSAPNAYWISMVIAVGLGVLIVAIGVFSRYGLRLTDIDPVFIYYGVIEEVFPFALVVLMIIVLLAVVISSADSFLMAGASSIVNDIIRPNTAHAGEKKMLLWSRLSVLIVSVIALVSALVIPELVNLMVTGTAMTVSGLLAPVVFGLFWKRVPEIAGIASMWGGLSVAVIWQVLGQPFDLHPIFIGLPLSIIILLIITLSTKPNAPARA